MLTLVLTVVLAKVYMYTHRGYSYSKSFVQSTVLIGVTITLIMVVIGSNIARAFALVGALSIIRFRNPVKDSRDIVFILYGNGHRHGVRNPVLSVCRDLYVTYHCSDRRL